MGKFVVTGDKSTVGSNMGQGDWHNGYMPVFGQQWGQVLTLLLTISGISDIHFFSPVLSCSGASVNEDVPESLVCRRL